MAGEGVDAVGCCAGRPYTAEHRPRTTLIVKTDAGTRGARGLHPRLSGSVFYAERHTLADIHSGSSHYTHAHTQADPGAFFSGQISI